MLYQIATLLLDVIGGLLTGACLLRLYMQCISCSTEIFYDICSERSSVQCIKIIASSTF